MLKSAKLEGFVLQHNDLEEVWRGATQEDLNEVAVLMTDLLMEHWGEALSEAAHIIKSEKER